MLKSLFLRDRPLGGKYSWEEKSAKYYQPIKAKTLKVWIDSAANCNPTIEEPFTKETGITFSVNPCVEELEIFARMKAGGSGADLFDAHFMTDPKNPNRLGLWREQMKDKPLLEPLDMRVLTNYGHLVGGADYWERSTKWDGEVYSIPQIWWTDQVAYNTEKVSEEDATSIEVLFDPKYRNKIGMVDHIFEGIAIAGIYTGATDPFNQTKKELKKSRKALSEQKKLVKKYWSSLRELEQLFAGKEVYVSWAWWSGIKNLVKRGFPLTWTAQKEGIVSGACYYAVYVESQNKYEAMQWLNYTLSQERGTRIFMETGYKPASLLPLRNKKVFTDEIIALHGFNNVRNILDAGFRWKTPDLTDEYKKIWYELKAT